MIKFPKASPRFDSSKFIYWWKNIDISSPKIKISKFNPNSSRFYTKRLYYLSYHIYKNSYISLLIKMSISFLLFSFFSKIKISLKIQNSRFDLKYQSSLDSILKFIFIDFKSFESKYLSHFFLSFSLSF